MQLVALQDSPAQQLAQRREQQQIGHPNMQARILTEAVRSQCSRRLLQPWCSLLVSVMHHTGTAKPLKNTRIILIISSSI
jgi:hypothetical protein